MNRNNILVVRVASLEGVDCRALRGDILESLRLGVLILGQDDVLEVMELPALGGAEVEPEEAIVPDPRPDAPAPTSSEAEEKRAIVQRLKDYRAAHGPGCLAAVSAKTARRRDRRISDDVLRHICADGAPKMPLQDWRSIGKALDTLELKTQP